jgi:hypothetical protein
MSHKQSSMEAEYMSLSDATREVLIRIQLFQDLRITMNTSIIYSNNQAAPAIARNPINYQQSKSIDIRYYFICQAIQNDKFNTEYIPMNQ